MPIIAFYSPRGGTGRSLAVANVAVALARKGNKIGIMDLDMEAGGLIEIFGIKADKVKGGIIDILKVGNVDEQLEDFILDISKLLNKADLRVKEEHLLFLPNNVTEDTVRNLDLIEKGINKTERNNRLLEAINTFWREKELDYLLLDTRTGFNEWSSLILDRADIFVILTRLNFQGLRACAWFLPILDKYPLNYLVVASSVYKPSANKSRIENSTKLLGHALNHILPFSEELAYREKLMVVEHPKSSLSKAYCDLAQQVEKK